MSRVLVVAAHPDDDILGPGGTILRHRAQGDDVEVIGCFTCRVPSGIRSANLPHGQDPLAWIEENIARIRPDTVYTHFSGDLNADHRAVSEAVRVACRAYASTVTRLLEFYTVSSTEWGEAFKPTVY